MLTRWVLAGSVLGVLGCATGPTPSPLLVSSTSNTFVPPTPVGILATNRSDRPLFLEPCLGAGTAYGRRVVAVDPEPRMHAHH
jgi:hypothetical protein